ncbi:DUF2079 domain-containing protein [bacterium]|nr:DUF2079 domain-containing protein [bacterium]
MKMAEVELSSRRESRRVFRFVLPKVSANFTADVELGKSSNGGASDTVRDSGLRTEEPACTQARPSLWRTCRERKWLGVFVIALLLLHGTLAVQTARYCSVTHDEYWHIPVGLLHWRSGRFDWENLNPPLIRMLAAAPLTVTAQVGEITEPTDQIWSYGDDLFAANRDNYRSLLIQARMPIVALSLLTALLLGCWATELFGVRSGILALFLWCVSPTVLASASLVTTDLGAAFFFALVGWRVWRFARRPNWRNSGWLGVCLGLAQLAKYTSVVLWPLSLFWYFLFAASGSGQTSDKSTDSGDSRGKPPYFKPLLTRWCAAIAISVVVLNLGYLFRGTGTSLADYRFSSSAMQSIQSTAGPLGRLPLPVPLDWLQGIDHQRQMMEADHPVYLNGEWSLRGFRGYYLYVLWYKLPHVVQCLLLASACRLWLSRSDSELLRTAGGLLLPVVALLVLASGSGMQLGIRYVLPVLPFLFLFASPLAESASQRMRSIRGLVTLATVAALLASLRFHPHHLAYFNELAGGPGNGWYLLSDSNIDWGQDLYGLQKWLDGNNIKRPRLAWFGTSRPQDVGIDFVEIKSPLREFQPPRPGIHAVSVCLLQGRPTPIVQPDGTRRVADLDEFGWLRFFEPEARIGWSVHIYRLTETDVRRFLSELQRAGTQQ